MGEAKKVRVYLHGTGVYMRQGRDIPACDPTLVIEGDWLGRITVILIDEALGF